jgi:ABC-type multidrug transport system fused ATPase/permease subunit
MINTFRNIFFLIKILNLKKKIIPINFLLVLNLILEFITFGLIIPFILLLLKPEALITFLENKYVEFFLSKLSLTNQNLLIENIGFFLMLIIIFVVTLRVGVGILCVWRVADFAAKIEMFLFEMFIKFYSIYEFKNENKKKDFLTTFSIRLPKASGSIIYSFNIFIELLIFIFLLVYILIFYLSEFLIILLISLISFVTILLLTSKKAKKYGIVATENTQKKTNILKGYIDGIREIFVYSAGKIFYQIVNVFNTNLLDAKKKTQVINSVPRFTLEFVFFTLLSIFLYLNLSKEGRTDQFADLAILGLLLLRIMPSINRISVNYNLLKISNESIIYVVEKIKRYQKKFNEKKIDNLKKFIEFKNVYFNYSKKEIFNNLNIKFFNKKSYLIFSESGSGKSSLIDLIIGYSKIDSGKILIDDQELIEHNSSWIEKISYVPQTSIIFDGSLRFNITFKKDNEPIDEKLFSEILKITKLDNFVNELQFKEFSLIKEFGSNISGGQKQRVSLARALYKDCNIIILDEASNAIDKETEFEILREIINKKNKLLIIISHNNSHFDLFDNVYQIQNKKIIKIK